LSHAQELPQLQAFTHCTSKVAENNFHIKPHCLQRLLALCTGVRAAQARSLLLLLLLLVLQLLLSCMAAPWLAQVSESQRRLVLCNK
jgi:hypothetical protein